MHGKLIGGGQLLTYELPGHGFENEKEEKKTDNPNELVSHAKYLLMKRI